MCVCMIVCMHACMHNSMSISIGMKSAIVEVSPALGTVIFKGINE